MSLLGCTAIIKNSQATWRHREIGPFVGQRVILLVDSLEEIGVKEENGFERLTLKVPFISNSGAKETADGQPLVILVDHLERISPQAMEAFRKKIPTFGM